MVGEIEMIARQTRCVDCNALGRITDRPALKPGPRCEEHHHARKRVVSKASHGKRLAKAFGITPAIYDALYEAQKAFIATLVNWKGEPLRGVCYGCGKAKGEGRRRLAVDHDHRCAELYGTDHAPEVGCPKCIRALLCAYCNEILGRLDSGALLRLVEVLGDDPPAQRMLRSIMVIEDVEGIGEYDDDDYMMSEDSF
jgi:hypothetical protein